MSIRIYLVLCALSIVIISCSAEIEEKAVDFREADQLLQEALRDDLFTGAVLLIAEGDELLHHEAYGFATLYNEDLRVVEHPDSMTTGHLFDLASLTKIFATTYGVMALHSDGKINIEESIAEYLPEFDKGQYREITVRHLLSHSSGMMAWFPTYYVASNKEERQKFIAERELLSAPGKRRRYSDLGFMILADIIEEVSGMGLEEYLEERIYSKLELQNTGFNPQKNNFSKIVSTSHGNPFERKMVYDPDFGYRIDIDPVSWNQWRNYTFQGEVNDGNAYYTHSGIAGHAGLFSTAGELYTLLRLVMNRGEYQEELIISPETIDLFTAEDKFGNGLGWAMDAAVLNAKELPQGALGHTGFTGTNFIMSPNDKTLYILLTNRQHIGVDTNGYYPNLRELRENLSEIVF
jgi:serine-type D-Ala-D-Ala carboxypeptidase